MRLLLIDVSHFFWSCWHATEDGPVSEAFEKTVAAVHSAAQGYELVAVCVDSPPYHRKGIAESYKSNREAQPAVAHEQFSRVKERLRKDGFLLWGAPGFEADDAIASAVRFAVIDPRITSTVVLSGDKDLLCLVNDQLAVTVKSTRTSEVFDCAAVRAKLDINPEQMTDFLSLVGDASDGIQGAKGIGKVTAADLLGRYGTLEGIWANLDKLKGAQRKNLEEGRANVELARKLVELRYDVPINFDELFAERKVEPLVELKPIVDDEEHGDAWEPEEEESNMGDVGELISAPPKANGAPVAEAQFEAPTARPTEALAVVKTDWTLALEPASLGKALDLATHLFESRMYPKFGSPQAILAVILRGRELGLGAATALELLSFFEGKVSVSAHLLIARAKAHPDCDWFQCVKTTATEAVWRTKNRNNPDATELSYTIQEAEMAGMLMIKEGKNPGNWHKRPAEMIRKTCGVFLARMEYPGALLGAYATEEIGE